METLRNIVFYIGLLSIGFVSSSLYSWAKSDEITAAPGTHTAAAIGVKFEGKKTQQKNNNLFTVLLSIAMIGSTVYFAIGRREKKVNRTIEKPNGNPIELPSENSINLSEEDLLFELENDWRGRLAPVDYIALVRDAPGYRKVHEWIVRVAETDFNFHEICSLHGALKDSKLQGSVRNYMKTWTRNELSKKRDKSMPRGSFIKQKRELAPSPSA